MMKRVFILVSRLIILVNAKPNSSMKQEWICDFGENTSGPVAEFKCQVKAKHKPNSLLSWQRIQRQERSMECLPLLRRNGTVLIRNAGRNYFRLESISKLAKGMVIGFPIATVSWIVILCLAY